MRINKKVLLRERKRHTARRVVSTPSVVLPGYPPGGVPSQVPPRGVPGQVPPQGGTRSGTPGGYPVRSPRGGTRSGTPPGGGVPGQVPPRGGVPGQVPPGGYPVRYPPGGVPGQVPPPGGVPGQVPPRLPHGILGNVAKHYGIWVPPPCGQTNTCENSTFPSYYVRGR